MSDWRSELFNPINFSEHTYFVSLFLLPKAASIQNDILYLYFYPTALCQIYHRLAFYQPQYFLEPTYSLRGLPFKIKLYSFFPTSNCPSVALKYFSTVIFFHFIFTPYLHL